MPDHRPIDDVIEACADALLTACAASQPAQPADIGEAWEQAVAALARVVQRTWSEGPRPR